MKNFSSLQVKIWFQNRRMKWRNSKERELLASGGSRDQTLPNKNNPNPDLSDARTDRQPSLSPASPMPSSPNLETQPKSQTAEHLSTVNNSASGMSADQFEMRKSNQSATTECNPKGDKMFKLEYDENRANYQQPQLFSNFYDKVRDMSNSVAFSSKGGAMNAGATSSAGNSSNFYYDEYESHSDSDEEISVT